MNPIFKFKNKIWLWSGSKSEWHFVSVPSTLSESIKGFYEGPKAGFGSIRVKVTIGKTTWNTSLFPDKKRNSYILPLKALVRKSEGLKPNTEIEVTIEII